MARRTREISIFNLSFLDVLSNALGAVVALMLISQHMAATSSRAASVLMELEEERARAERDVELAVEEEEALQRVLDTLKGEKKASEELIRELLRAKAELETFQFRGMKTAKKEVVLLLDLSASMYDERHVLRKGAEVVLSLLRHDRFVRHHFDVYTFRSLERPLVERWPLGRLEASPENRAKAVKWIRELPDASFDGETPTWEAFRTVFGAFPEGVVFLLTDGAPTDGVSDDLAALLEEDPRRLGAVRQRILAAKPPGVEVRCLGIGNEFYRHPSFRRFLEELADVKDGSLGCVGL